MISHQTARSIVPRALRHGLIAIVFAGAAISLMGQSPPQLPVPTASKLPRWRGFNLLEQFYLQTAKPFQEEDFRLIAKLGFNFVRLPLDYRIWIRDGDPAKIDESKLAAIDQAVALGKKYGIHVCINFHRAPGYSVNLSPKEPRDLWTDAEIQDICAKHWAVFARRYKDSDNAHVSFNLLNEPSGVDEAGYAAVVRKLVAAIRAEDPKRLIIADGLQWGNVPAKDIADLGVAQATRGYQPFSLSHYRAAWYPEADTLPLPTWPVAKVSQFLFGRPEVRSPLVIEGGFTTPTTLRLHVTVVSKSNVLTISADGQPVLVREFKPGPGEGEWKKASYNEKYTSWQNLYDLDVIATIPAGTKRVECQVGEGGDWLRLSEIGLRPQAEGEAGRERVLPLALMEFGVKQEGSIRWQPDSPDHPLLSSRSIDRASLQRENLGPWLAFAKERKVGIFVGEWGSYDKTPHAVVMAWMGDSLQNFQEDGLGWALWSFRGSFGILDSNRQDVQYEDFEGHKLDRKMLELLQRY